ncbi:hypothetical protein HQ584_00980 [Patescibacteria group bacterium]|nr:hypothetical protein [Patescibacteria group bacterium]
MKQPAPQQNKKYGFIPPEIVSEDFWFGSKKLGSKIINPSGDWQRYLPVMEQQNILFEPSACVSFGITSALEMIHNLLWQVEPNYSDRYVAKISDTDPDAGNTPKKVSEAIREYGTVPEEDWPMTKTLEEYYKDIPVSIKDIGEEWTENYGFGYEYTDADKLKEALKRSPVGCAVSAWEQNEAGEYVFFGQYNHWCVCVAFDEQDRMIVWDSYDSGLKTLEKGFPVGFPQIYMLNREKAQPKTCWQKITCYFKRYVDEWS